MTEAAEKSYIQGTRASWLQMLRLCLSELGYEGDEAQAAAWVVEREAAIVALREICTVYGDNDWDSDLHLADIIGKHLGV